MLLDDWRFPRLIGGEDPEVILQKNVESRPIWPFYDIYYGTYLLRTINKKFIYGILIFTATVTYLGVAILKLGLYNVSDNAWFFCILAIACGLILIVTNRGVRELAVFQNNDEYTYCIRGELVYSGPLHNLYIRLESRSANTGKLIYYLSLSGFMVEEEVISGYSPNDKQLRKLGKKLARNLNLNFFSDEDTSNKHVIIHYPNVYFHEEHHNGWKIKTPSGNHVILSNPLFLQFPGYNKTSSPY